MAKQIKRWINIISMIIVLVPLIVIGALFAAVSLIDFNNYKPQIEQEIANKTGRDFIIHGDIKVSALPLKFSVETIELSETDKTKQFATADKVVLRLSLLDLIFKQQANITAIELINPTINLVTNTAGEVNWKLAKNSASELGFQKVGLGNNTESKSLQLNSQAIQDLIKLAAEYNFQLQALTVKNAEIIYLNQISDLQYKLSQLEVLAFNLALDQIAVLHLQGTIQNYRNFDKINFKFNTEVELTSDNKILLNKFNSDSDIFEQTENYNFDLSFDNLEYLLTENQATIKQLQINQQFSSKKLELDLNSFKLVADLNFDKVNPKNLLDVFAIQYPDFVNQDALTNLTGSFNLVFNQDFWQLSAIDLTLDNTKLTGEFTNNFAPETIDFNLHFDQLNFDYYAANYEASTETSDKKPADKNDNKTSNQKIEDTYIPVGVPVNTLRTYKINGDLTINNLQILNGSYQNITSKITSEFGVLNLAPFDLDLYQGKLVSKLQVNVNDETPKYKLDAKLTNINNQAWLSAIVDFDKLAGNLNSHLNLTSAGSNLDAVKYNLNGRINLELTDGSYQQLDINRLLSGKETRPGDATKFSRATLQGDIINGILHLQNSQLISDAFSANLLGKVNIPQAEFANEIQLTYQQPPKQLMLLQNIQIPIQLTGEIKDPKWGFDLEAFLKPENINQVLERFMQRL